MDKRKFDFFYYLLDHKIHPFSEVEETYKEVDSSLSEYSNYMMCPECHKAQLTYKHGRNGRPGYLAKKSNFEHEDGCTYAYKEASKKQVEKYVSNLTEQQIKSKLETAINLLIRNMNQTEIDSKKNSERYINTFVIRADNAKKAEYKTIPRKSLNAWLDKELVENTYIFYGKVRLKTKNIISKSNFEYHMLDIYTFNQKKGEWVYKISTYRGKIVDKIAENKEYAIALIGNIVFEYGYMQLKLLNPFAIDIEEIN